MLRKLLANTALVFGSLVVALILVEVVLRFTPYATLPARYSYPTGYFVADDALGYDIGRSVTPRVHPFAEHPYPVFSNRLGCFDHERAVPDDYVLVVGDSFAWGYTPLEDKWTTLLEQRSGQFILKCGVTGYGTRQELLKAQRVVAEVGKNPRLVVLLYTENDLNDDLYFPQRTVYGDGHLVSTRSGADLLTGEVKRLTPEQIRKRYAKYVAGSWSNRFDELLASSVLYRLWLLQRPAFREWKAGVRRSFRGGNAEPMAGNEAKPMPKKMKGTYSVPLHEYLATTDRPWFNQLLETHAATLRAFADYAHSLGAQLVIVDAKGTLAHPRFQALQAALAADGRTVYVNLGEEYPQQAVWRYDLHWNVEGNHAVAEILQRTLSRHGLLGQTP